MQLGAHVRQLDQVGQLAVARRLHLAAVLAQLGRDPGQAQRGVDLFLASAQDLAAVFALQGLLGEREPLLERQLAQAHVVVFGAGGVLQGGAEALRRVHPQLGAQAVGELHAGFDARPAPGCAPRPGG